ncbi:Ribonuclease H-like superfamily [Sesbania bispinosa]|nr:Ribonuclease H-like superfamily [Sesbania bispinosa]
MHLVNWNAISRPKNVGGLGLRDAWLSKVAFLRKMIWRLLNEDNKFWVEILKHKYMPNSTILQATTSPYDSYIWKSICKAKDIMKDGFSLRIGSGNSSLWYSVWSELGKICDLVDYVHISDNTLQVRDIWLNDLWSFNNLTTPISNNIKEFIQGIPIPKFCQIEDTWCWNKSLDGCYSVKAGYTFLLNQALPTNELRHHRNLASSPACPRCSCSIESPIHYMRDCPHSLEVWSRLGVIAHSDFLSTSFIDWTIKFASGSDGFKFMVTYWWLWRWRNNFIFDVVPWSIKHPPDAGYIKVNVDGNCIISSGFCGAGGLLCGCDNQWLAGFSMNLGKVGVLAAELYVIRQGLMICMDMGYSYIWCESDSIEAVRLCLLSVIPLHHRLAVVIADIHQLMRKSNRCLISHVLREGNASADLLAKHDVSQVDSFKLWHEPPSFLGSALLADSMGITFLR